MLSTAQRKACTDRALPRKGVWEAQCLSGVNNEGPYRDAEVACALVNSCVQVGQLFFHDPDNNMIGECAVEREFLCRV